MQKQAPIVHVLEQELESLLRKLRFMQVKCVTDSADVTVIDVSDPGNYLPLEEVFIGQQTMQYLEDEVALMTSDILVSFPDPHVRPPERGSGIFRRISWHC